MTAKLVSVGDRIQQLRLQKGLTQSELSRGLCTPSLISQIEGDKARPSYRLLAVLADRLGVSLDRLLDDVDLNLETQSMYKMARAYLAATEYANAMTLYRKLLEKPHANVSRKHLLLDLAKCCIQTDQLTEAESLLQELQGIAELLKEPNLLAEAYMQSAIIAYKRKRYQLAYYQLHKALEEVEKAGKVAFFLKGDLLYQLGMTQCKLGCIADANESFQQALQCFSGTSHFTELGMSYLKMSETTSGQLNHLGKALDYAERAAAIFEGLGRITTNLQLQVSQAALRGKQGDIEGAIVTIRDAIDKSLQYGHPDQAGSAFVELAKLLFDQGDEIGAEECVFEAQKLIPNDNPQSGWVDYLLGKIALRRDQWKQAIQHFEKSADCFQKAGEYGIWEDIMGEIATLYAEKEDFFSAYEVSHGILLIRRRIMQERGIAL